MNRVPQSVRSTLERAFTLSEVTISVGIISAILLPVLGLLATGTRLSTESRDKAAASAIASTITESFQTEGGSNGTPFLLLGPDVETAIQTSGGEAVYASFTSTGNFVRVVSEGEFETGLQNDDASLYLTKTYLEPVAPEQGSVSRRYPLLSLKIEVEQPAIAAKANRTRLLFTSRVSSP